MENLHTLVLTPWMTPHRICNWMDAICLLVDGKIDVLEEYEETVSSPSVTFAVPAVAVLRKPVRHFKKGVKFSRINILVRDKFQCQYCLSPDHKILTADLRWIKLGDLVEGDALVGFDEGLVSPGGRRFRESLIESHTFDEDDLFLVTLDDGTQFKATREHQWLSRAESKLNLSWCTTDSLVGRTIPRLFDVWSTEDTREAGWASGMFDGEGWLAKGRTLQAAFAPGYTLERMKQFMRDRGIDFGTARVNEVSECIRLSLRGGYADQARFLGTVRPERLLGEFSPVMLGRVASDNYRKVVSVVPAGRGEIVKMRTSSSTFVADGFPHHNCGKTLPPRKLNYDHVIPRAQGGKTVFENIASSCFDCNSKKADRTPEQAGMKLLRVPVKPTTLPMSQPFLDITRVPECWRPYLAGNTVSVA